MILRYKQPRHELVSLQEMQRREDVARRPDRPVGSNVLFTGAVNYKYLLLVFYKLWLRRTRKVSIFSLMQLSCVVDRVLAE